MKKRKTSTHVLNDFISAENRVLARKFGIQPWLKLRIDLEPKYLGIMVTPLCEDNIVSRQGVCDIAFVAPTSAAEWKQKARRLKPAIDPDGVIWVLYPREDFRVQYSFDGSLPEMQNIVRDLDLEMTDRMEVNEELLAARFSVSNSESP